MGIPLAPPAPRLDVTTYRNHPLLTARLDVADADISLLVLRDEHEHCHVTDLLERDMLLKAEGAASELELYQALANFIHDDGSWATSLGELVESDWGETDYHLFASPCSEESIRLRAMAKAIGRMPNTTAKFESKFCRDEDCDSDHLWWAVDFDLSAARPGHFVWHVNRRSGLVVPPTPLVVTAP